MSTIRATNNGLVSIDRLTAKFNSLGLFKIITPNSLLDIVMEVAREFKDDQNNSDIRSSNDDLEKTYLSYNQFIVVIDRLSQAVTLRCDELYQNEVDRDEASAVALLEYFAKELMKQALYSLLDEKLVSKYSVWTIEDSYSTVSLSTILWIFRQSGLLALPGVNLSWLRNQLEIYAETDHTSVPAWSSENNSQYLSSIGGNYSTDNSIPIGTSVWRIKNLPYIFHRIVEKATSIPLPKYMKSLLISTLSRDCLYIVYVLPTILFLKQVTDVFQEIKVLYTIEGIKFVSEFDQYKKQLFESLSSYCQESSDKVILCVTSSHKLIATNCKMISISNLIEYFIALQVIPQKCKADKVIDICYSILSRSSSSVEHNNPTKIFIPLEMVIEVVFVLAQQEELTEFLNYIRNSNKVLSPLLDSPSRKNSQFAVKMTNYITLLKLIIGVNLDEVESEADTTDIKVKSLPTHSSTKLQTQYNSDPTSVIVATNNLHRDIIDKKDDPSKSFAPIRVESSITNKTSDAIMTSDTSIKPILKSSAQSAVGNLRFRDDPLREIVILLMHYPISSFDLNPWDVARDLATVQQVINRKNKDSNNKDKKQNTDIDAALTELLRIFNITHGVSSKDLSDYFSSFYNEENQKHFDDTILTNAFFDYLMEERTLKLLFLNCDLLKWEFTRCISKYKNSSDPFTDSLLVPIVTNTIMNKNNNIGYIIRNSMIKWGLDMTSLSENDLNSIFLSVIMITKDYTSHKYMTFSTFIIFAIQCYTYKTINYQIADKSTLNTFIDGVRAMLYKFSAKLTYVQQTIRMRVLRPLFGTEKDYLKEPLDKSDRVAILKTSLNLFQKYLNTSQSSTNSSLSTSMKGLSSNIPPRPPTFVWDMPRFIEFCKFIGILSTGEIPIEIAAVSFALYQQDAHPKSIEGWDYSSITPMPIKVNIDTLNHLIESISWTVLHSKTFLQLFPVNKGANNNKTSKLSSSSIDIDGDSDKINDEGEINIWKLYFKTITPSITSYVCSNDDNSNNKSIELRNTFIESPALEDIVRYGGYDALASLSTSQDFIWLSYYSLLQQTYGKLITPSLLSKKYYEDLHLKDLEIPMNVVCKFLNCNDMIRTGAMAVQAKRSLRMRNRPIYFTKASFLNESMSSQSGSQSILNANHNTGSINTDKEMLTVSFVEFEELFIRSAFLMWEISGALEGDHRPKAMNFIQPKKTNSSALSDKELQNFKDGVKLYCDECEKVAINVSIRKNEGKRKLSSSWGIDFIKPYSSVMQKYAVFPTKLLHSFKNFGGFGNPKPLGLLHSDIEEINGISTKSIVKATGASSPSATRRHGSYSEDNWLLNAADSSIRSIMGSDGRNNNNISNLASELTDTKQLDSKLTASELENGSEALSEIYNMRLNYSIADPGIRRKDNLTINTAEAEATRREGVSSTKSHISSSRRSFPPPNWEAIPSPILDNKDRSRVQKSIRFQTDNRLPDSELVDASINMTSLPFDAGDLSEVAADHLTDSLLAGTKEALWPVYATYCSCGDSTDPGKLSGPNLFTLLSKLDVLTDRTLLSDVGVLLHQISAHSFTSTAMTVSMLKSSESGSERDSPSLSFEEFLVYLCTFSQLRFEGVVVNLRGPTSSSDGEDSREEGQVQSAKDRLSKSSLFRSHMQWFKKWQAYMGTSKSFSRLLEERVLPILKHQTLLAFPEDARLRDRFSVVFSLEVLLAIEGAEGPLQTFFEQEKRYARRGDAEATSSGASVVNADKLDVDVLAIVEALKRIHLVPTVISELQVLQLIKDVMPEINPKGLSKRNKSFSPESQKSNSSEAKQQQQPKREVLLFPQWEWVLCVVAFQAVETAVQQSTSYTDPKVRYIFISKMI